VLGNVMRQGYKLGDQVLRHAMVGVVDAVDGAEASDTSENPGDAGDEHAESNE
jgi:molecular chaperone GrpE